MSTDEGDSVLKVTRSGDDQAGSEADRRELDFYLTRAAEVPVHTPRLIDHLDDDRGVVLLLTAHAPADPAADWDDASWMTLAADLAALHDSPVPTEQQWHRGSWITDMVRDHDHQAARRFWSWPGDTELLGPVLDDPTVLTQSVSALAPRFVHGDCHAANLLREQGSIIWIDWQSAGVGSPVADLAFASVRGVPDGAHLPLTAMIGEYAALRGLDVEEVTRATLAAELAIFLLLWPAYAGYNTEAAIGRAHRRVIELARVWRTG